MSRRVGQVTALQALVGMAVIAAAVAGVVALCNWLALPSETVAELEAPAEDEPVAAPGEVRCPGRIAGGPGPAEASATDLIDCPDLYDGQRIAYAGEVVGAVLQRGRRAWVQLNDDAYGLSIGPLPEHRTTVGGNSGMAVSVPVEIARRITHVGGHDQQGDMLAVVGTFRRADPADGGGPTIHADEATLTVRGHTIPHQLSFRRLVVATALAFATVAVTAVWRVRNRT